MPIFFHFLLLEIKICLQNQIKRIIFGIKSTISVKYDVFRKIKISHYLAVITAFRFTSGIAALPVTGHVGN